MAEVIDQGIDDSDLSKEERDKLRELAWQKKVAEGEVKGSDDVLGGMMTTGEGVGGYRRVSVCGQRFVGSPEETVEQVRAVLEKWEKAI